MNSDETGEIAQAAPPDEGAFLLVGEALALDLVNTEGMRRGKLRDWLPTPHDVLRWWRVVWRRYPDTIAIQGVDEAFDVDMATFAALKALRAALRGIFSAIADGAAPDAGHVDTLNAALAGGVHAITRAPDGALLSAYRTQPGAEPMVFAIALSAALLIRDGDHRRLHRCDNARCVLLFYDTTRSATRRWCSVGCMERARSSRRYRAAKLLER